MKANEKDIDGLLDDLRLNPDSRSKNILIHIVKPDILVKGGDYELDEIVSADFVLKRGGLVETIPFVDGYSTTNMIEKIGRDFHESH